MVPAILNDVSIDFGLFPTRLDGKGKSFWSDTATTDCHICGANLVERGKRFSKKFLNMPVDRLAMGPGQVHTEMRALEWCIIASTHQDIKTRSDDHPQAYLVESRLNALQDEAFERIGVRLSKCSGGNQGTSNNGPTAKACFENPELMAEVFKLPVWLVKGIKCQIRALSACNVDIDPEVQRAKGQDWLDLFHDSQWAWNTLTPTMHSLFWHSWAMIKLFPFPIGLSSEEGSEGDNKVVRLDRAHHTPQKGLKDQLKALMHRSHQKANPRILRLTPDPVRPERSLDYIQDWIAEPQPRLKPPPPIEE